MAIDLFCYSLLSTNDVESILTKCVQERNDLFAENFLLSSVKVVDGVYKEISSEYGFAALSRFIISLNNKNASNQIGEVVDVIKSSFGGYKILVLWENERSL